MKYEKSSGAIIFREASDGLKYLLLAYPGLTDKEKVYWGFPKGHAAAGESDEETARREVREETGLTQYSFVPGFKEKENYLFRREGDLVSKTSVYFLAQTTQEEVKISMEHLGFEWLPIKDAVERLTFKNAKELLQKAEDFLETLANSAQQKMV